MEDPRDRSGPGIPPVERAHIFDPLLLDEGARHRARPPLTQQIVAAHAGRIPLRRRPERRHRVLDLVPAPRAWTSRPRATPPPEE
ncbi:MAG: hypothetical protein M5U28_07530 [Sandaracinaceae bacterium]|nr:hypothetical protein [Sandaracinaceae bacterium]